MITLERIFTPNTLEWIFTTFALVGTVFNVKRRREGFVFWLISNVGMGYTFYKADQEAYLSLMVIYSCLSIWGFAEWKRPAICMCQKEGGG